MNIKEIIIKIFNTFIFILCWVFIISGVILLAREIPEILNFIFNTTMFKPNVFFYLLVLFVFGYTYSYFETKRINKD